MNILHHITELSNGIPFLNEVFFLNIYVLVLVIYVIRYSIKLNLLVYLIVLLIFITGACKCYYLTILDYFY